MAIQNIPQGQLQRLRGSISIPAYPELTITASFLGPEGINLNPSGAITDQYPSMTGTVPSPGAYQMYTVEVELLKTQGFADSWKQQLEFNSFIGPFTVRTDSTELGNYLIQNGSIENASPGRINGTTVGFALVLSGYYQINSFLYDQ